MVEKANNNDDIKQIKSDVHDIAVIIKILAAILFFETIAVLGFIMNGGLK
jgi:hypothetical protein